MPETQNLSHLNFRLRNRFHSTIYIQNRPKLGLFFQSRYPFMPSWWRTDNVIFNQDWLSINQLYMHTPIWSTDSLSWINLWGEETSEAPMRTMEELDRRLMCLAVSAACVGVLNSLSLPELSWTGIAQSRANNSPLVRHDFARDSVDNPSVNYIIILTNFPLRNEQSFAQIHRFDSRSDGKMGKLGPAIRYQGSYFCF